jgi:trimeric autotransporter adhesin
LLRPKCPFTFTALFSSKSKTMNPTARNVILLGILIFISQLAFSQAPSNDDCASASLLTSYANSCTATTAGTVLNATSSGIAVNSCGGTPDDDVWYKFVAQGMSTTISLTNIGNGNPSLSKADARVEVFYASAGNCSNLTYETCQAVTNSTSLTLNAALTAGNTYYVRVFSATAGAPTNNAGFNICVTYTPFPPPPSNDSCGSALTLTSGTASSGTVWYATPSPVPVGCATGDPDDDVWYKITTTTFSNSLSISVAPGTDLNTSGTRVQVFTGTCGSLTSFACGTTSLTTPVSGNTTYYIRVYSAGTGVLATSAGSGFTITATVTGINAVTAGRTNEVFQKTTLSPGGALQYPWEITYGPDSMLWVTEARGYKVYRMDPNTGAKTPVLDLNSSSTDLSAWSADSLVAQGLNSTSNWNSTVNNWPQGGLAGLAIHPRFGDGSNHDFVYISYVHRYLSTATGSAGIFFRNKIVRFTYNTVTKKLGSPAVVCDTIPGGQDHNSQRMIIAPVTAGGTYYLFYAAGDMGAGQYANRMRPENAQNLDSYEGKILRFNLEPDGDGGLAVSNAWIPDDNPYNAGLGKQSAVYAIGIRNNQGFAYDTVTNKLYGASHGPYSDDEINIIEKFKNYGHPWIEGYVDGNYDGTYAASTDSSVSAGAPYTDTQGQSTCPPIGSESNNKLNLDAVAGTKGQYKDPLFSAYAASRATVLNIWRTNPGNALPAPGWPTEAWSGLDLYSNKLIPGWKRSLVVASLKWGRLVRLKLSTDGNTTAPYNKAADTVTYLNSQNRFRDLAFSPDGKDIFVVMDNNSTTSGPGSANPTVPTCAGCVEKYTFLGYLPDATGRSTIFDSIDVAAGTANACQTGTTIVINSTNNNLWVPITGQDGNILAEIKANGNNLDTVRSSFYTNTGAVRENSSKRLYSDRNITITPKFQPSSPVSVRIYMTAAEYNSLRLATNSQGVSSGITSIGNVSIVKNSDACGSAMTNPTITITSQFAESFGSNYVVQGDISSFSTFYLANPSQTVLPLQLLTFTGRLQSDNSALVQWKTSNELNTAQFVVERSLDGSSYVALGVLPAKGTAEATYSYVDADAGAQSATTLYYRLKSVDNNGQYSFSKIVTIVLAKNINVFLFPNPVKQTLNVQINGSVLSPISMQITDMNGRVVHFERRNVASSSTTLTLDVKQWKPQVYIIKILNSKNELITTQKFQKM